jgi:hypothetical protein
MKNYWLLASGFALGVGVSSALISKEEEVLDDKYKEGKRTESFYYLAGGALLLIGALTMFKNK